MEFLEVFGAAAFGALLGAALAWFFDRRKVQVETAFNMHREYFDSLVEERESMVRFIQKHRDGGDLAKLWRSVDPKEMECVWKIVYFYERLWAALTHGYVSRKLVPELFGAAFNYWYVECFDAKLVPVNDPIALHIADLRRRLLKLAGSGQVEGWEKYRQVWQLDSATSVGP